ncbi:unnamed protein product, partial [Hapterophycus canaliculatus]
YVREGSHPGARREPSLTMINSTLLLQGGKVDLGEWNEQCDSRFFLLDLGDPDGVWREGPAFPGECGLGQTMDTVNVTRTDDSGKTVPLAVVFGGCKWDSAGVFTCSNDLYAYDPGANTWSEIIPESDEDAFACTADDTEVGPELSHTQHPASMSGSGNPGNSSGVGGEDAGEDATDGGSSESIGEKKKKEKKAVCPGASTSRPLGRHAHASAYIESKADGVNALFIFGGRENADDLAPLGDLW